MTDAQYDDPRLARVYDALGGERTDLPAYVAIVAELGAHRVLDVGCGTGCLALLLAERGSSVTGVDPAAASLDVARAKRGADLVEWVHGDATAARPASYDLAVMTGNVAQVFVSDESWERTLSAICGALVPGGHLVFETRRPDARAWESWTPDRMRNSAEVPEVGAVENRLDDVAVDGELVSFRWTYEFQVDGSTLHSDSTLRFRDETSVRVSLKRTGYDVLDVREAPDRPGLELVFVARRR